MNTEDQAVPTLVKDIGNLLKASKLEAIAMASLLSKEHQIVFLGGLIPVWVDIEVAGDLPASNLAPLPSGTKVVPFVLPCISAQGSSLHEKAVRKIMLSNEVILAGRDDSLADFGNGRDTLVQRAKDNCISGTAEIHLNLEIVLLSRAAEAMLKISSPTSAIAKILSEVLRSAEIKDKMLEDLTPFQRNFFNELIENPYHVK